MGSKNNQAADLTDSLGAAIEPEKGVKAGVSGAGIEPEKESCMATNLVKMDINRYLEKSKISKSLANLLRVMFKGQMAAEAEWDVKTQEALNRGVN